MTAPTREKLSSIKKYLYEYVLIILVSSVAFLFNLYIDLNKYINTDLMKQNLEMKMVIERNTNVIQQLRIK